MRSHFIRLLQAVSKELINCLYHKVSYYYIITDPVITLFSPNEIKTYLRIYYQSIVNFGIIGFCLGFSNTSCVEILDWFRKTVVGKIKTDVFIQKNHLKIYKMKIQYENEFVQKLGMGDPTLCVYQFVYDENDNDDT